MKVKNNIPMPDDMFPAPPGGCGLGILIILILAVIAVSVLAH